jgi:hypothetical protein
VRDFLRLWCEQHERETLTRALAARKAHDELKDKTTRYAEAIRRIARAHEAAAAVYRAELERDYA